MANDSVVTSLDWDLYCRLNDPVAKRLYRLLDKRFYRVDRLVLDLHDLAVHKVRLSEKYNTAHIKRALLNGIRELELLWDLRAAEPEERFRKVSAGKWEAVFERKAKAVRASVNRGVTDAQTSPLAESLKTRGVSPKMAERLAKQHSAERITKTVSLFDWHAQRGDKKGPGFLVAEIRSSEGFEPPPNFSTDSDAAAVASNRPERKLAPKLERVPRPQPEAGPADHELADFLRTLSSVQLEAFEREAVQAASPMKQAGYERNLATGAKAAFELYRAMVLRDHFHSLKQVPS